MVELRDLAVRMFLKGANHGEVMETLTRMGLPAEAALNCANIAYGHFRKEKSKTFSSLFGCVGMLAIAALIVGYFSGKAALAICGVAAVFLVIAIYGVRKYGLDPEYRN